MQNRDTLSDFGTSFQTKVLSALITDRGFIDRTREIIHTDFFESESNQWIVDTITEYYDKYAIPPTLDVFKIQIKQSIDDRVFRDVVIEQLKNVYGGLKSPDLLYVKDQFTEFCKNQRMKQALLRSVDFLQTKNFEAIQTEIKAAQTVGIEFDIGHNYFNDVSERMTDTARDTIKTPWEVINFAMDGGLGPGELGVIMAPTGGGKSWVLGAIAKEAIIRGKTVCHITLELSEKYTGRRYDSIFTGIPSQEVLSKSERVTNHLGNLKDRGELMLKYYPPKAVTVNMLRAYIERLIAYGVNPNLIIIDYADLLRSASRGNNDSKYDEMGSIYEELRGLAGELQLPIWTASQTNRSGMDKQIIQADSIADSFAKAMTSDFMMSISRTTSDKVTNKGRIHIVKNRFGPDGLTFPANMDLSNGDIEIFDVNSSSGHVIRNGMGDDSDVEQQLLYKKFKELKRSRSAMDDE
jgi:replicative DNA helicase